VADQPQQPQNDKLPPSHTLPIPHTPQKKRKERRKRKKEKDNQEVEAGEILGSLKNSPPKNAEKQQNLSNEEDEDDAVEKETTTSSDALVITGDGKITEKERVDEFESDKYEVVEEAPRRSSRRKASEKWSATETAKFYKAIQMVGTDFTLIELLLPNRTRSQIRNKFKREEKEYAHKITNAMENRIPLDLEWFKEVGMDLEAEEDDDEEDVVEKEVEG